MKITFDLKNPVDCRLIKEIIDSYGDLSGIFTADPVTVQRLQGTDTQEGVTQEVSVVKEAVAQEVSVAQEKTDINGVPWSVNYHTPQKTLTGKGLWRRAQRITKKQYDDYAASFLIPPVPALVQAAPVTATAPVPALVQAAPVTATATDVDLLSEIDTAFADLDELGKIDNFAGWASSILNWAKPGTDTIFDLEGDLKAQQKLLDHLKTLQ